MRTAPAARMEVHPWRTHWAVCSHPPMVEPTGPMDHALDLATLPPMTRGIGGAGVLEQGILAGIPRTDALSQMRTIVTRWHGTHPGERFPGWDAVIEAMPTDSPALASLYGQDAVRLCAVLTQA